MSYVISPKHKLDEFKHGVSLDDKIEIFVARVEGWQLGIARQIVENDIPDRGFAILQIIFSYFEMTAKYHEGYVGERNSNLYFEKGIRNVFPLIEKLPDEIQNELVEYLYKRVRNGIYHIGLIKSHIVLTGNLPTPLKYESAIKRLSINPDRLVSTLERHFARFVAELRNPHNLKLRESFEKRFDFDNNSNS